MFCAKCGSALTGGAFCGTCGNPVEAAASQLAAATVPAATPSAPNTPPPAQAYINPNVAPQTLAYAKTNGLAIAGFVLSIVCGGVLALVLSIIGLNQINNSNGTQRGKGLAIAGIVLGAITTIGWFNLFAGWL